MKKELFEYTKEEAQEFLAQEGIRELDYVQDDGYKLYGESLQAHAKMRFYEDGSAKVEITVPNQLQCVPCGIHYNTEKTDKCPVCGATDRDIMLRNKITEEPFREFEYMYGKFLTATLRVAQPLCAWIGDNYTEDFAREAHQKALEERKEVLEEMKKYSWFFADDIIEQIKALKAENNNVYTMRKLTGGDYSDEALLEFNK